MDHGILGGLLTSWEQTEGTDNDTFRLGVQVLDLITLNTDRAMEAAFENVAPAKRTFDYLLRQFLYTPITVTTADGEIVDLVEGEPTVHDLFEEYTEKNLGQTIPIVKSPVKAAQGSFAALEEPPNLDDPFRQFTGEKKRPISQVDLNSNSPGSSQSLFAKAPRTSGEFQESQHLRLLKDSILVLGKAGAVRARVVTWTDTTRNNQNISAVTWNRRAALMPRWLCDVVTTFINRHLATAYGRVEHLNRIPLSVALKILGISEFTSAATSMEPDDQHAPERFGMQCDSYYAQLYRMAIFELLKGKGVYRCILGGLINQESGKGVWNLYPISPEAATRYTQDLTWEEVQQRLKIYPAAEAHDDVVQEDP